MNDENVYQEESTLSESFSAEIERDARRYNKAFTEEEEVRFI